VVPRGKQRFELNGVRFEAGGGREVALALTGHFADDASLGGVAWLVPKKGAGGELWYFPAEGAPRRVYALPNFIPTTDCTLAPRLAQSGPRTVFVDVSARCGGAFVERAPLRAVAVLAPARASSELVGLRLAQPAPGEELEVSADSRDQDADGRDDVSFSVTLKVGEQRAAAWLKWLDRAAGPSRDPSQPAASLNALAQAELSRARSKKNAASVLANLRAAQRLFGSLCAESGTARVFDGEGSPLNCGKLDRFVDDAALAEVESALSRGAVLEALGVLERDGWFVHAMSKQRRDVLVKGIEKATRSVSPSQHRRLEARPVSGGRVRFAPFTFEPAGTLLIQTEAGLARVAADASREEVLPSEDAPAPWALDVRLADGSVANAVHHACGRSELMLDRKQGANPAEPLPLSELISARPGACAGRAMRPITALPLASGMPGLVGIVAGARVGELPSGPALPGSARSPDGVHTVVPTPLGLLVLGGDKPELWRSAELSTDGSVSTCVVANGARSVACLDRDGIEWLGR
jgi:hypothetical protein